MITRHDKQDEVSPRRPTPWLPPCAGAMILLSACAPSPELTPGTCSPLGYDKATLLELKAEGFEVADAGESEDLAMGLLGCLGHPDPDLRDGIAYEALVSLLRERRLAPESIRRLRAELLQQLTGPDSDEDGFRRPFAALVLAEVARADRIEPVLTDDERAGLVDAAVGYMRNIDDYRGFDEKEGWRHAVAHTADLLMQLALNPGLGRESLMRIRDGIGVKVAPPGEHFYVYGEGQRLARPILFAASRGVLGEDEWTSWFATLAAPAPFDEWDEVWHSQSGLAKLHNTRAFAQAVYVNASASENEELKRLLPGVLDLLRALP